MERKLAIIDCGTNTFHLLISEISNGNKILHQEKRTVKIGQGGIGKKIILPEARERALLVLHAFSHKILEYGVTEVHAFATSAFRNAENGREFRDIIYDDTGIDIKIIPGEEEAEWIYQGVRSALNIGETPGLIMDIGGGSVEFILAGQDSILWKQSFEIGAQRLLDNYFPSDPIPEESVKELENYLAQELHPLFTILKQYKPECLIGASGTFDTLSAMYMYLNGQEPDRVSSEMPLTIESYYILHKKLLEYDQSQRLAIPGMVEMRVDMIVVASCLIDFILKNTSINNIRVSRYALKEGVLARLINSGKL